MNDLEFLAVMDVNECVSPFAAMASPEFPRSASGDGFCATFDGALGNDGGARL